MVERYCPLSVLTHAELALRRRSTHTENYVRSPFTAPTVSADLMTKSYFLKTPAQGRLRQAALDPWEGGMLQISEVDGAIQTIGEGPDGESSTESLVTQDESLNSGSQGLPGKRVLGLSGVGKAMMIGTAIFDLTRGNIGVLRALRRRYLEECELGTLRVESERVSASGLLRDANDLSKAELLTSHLRSLAAGLST